MTTRPPRFRHLRLAAVMVTFSFLCAACGTGVSLSTAERASGDLAALATEAVPTLEAVPVGEQPGSDTAPAAGGHSYGTSIDDWGSSQDSDANESSSSEFASITWQDLIPPGHSVQDVVGRYEERLDAVEVGSAAANALYNEMQAEFDPEATNPGLDGQKIRLAGFVAPLTYDGELITEFLLVPTFGACIHVPPPPPNQTILVTVSKGLTTDEAWGPVWVEGTLDVTAATTELASVSYTISSASSGVYDTF